MPAASAPLTPLESQLLVQLGDRLRAARLARGQAAGDLAEQVGISRTTLGSVERGDPSPTMGTYLRVMSALGCAGDLVMLATRAPRGAERVNASNHAPQDLQSLLMHKAAVDLLRRKP